MKEKVADEFMEFQAAGAWLIVQGDVPPLFLRRGCFNLGHFNFFLLW